MKDYYFWKKVLAYIESEYKVILILVLNHEGSAPGKQGFKLVINSNGEKFGTIGGGVMEMNLIKKSVEYLSQETEIPEFIRRSHYENAPEEEKSGLICSGSQDLVMIKITSDFKNKIEYLINSYENTDFGVLQITSKQIELIKNKQIAKKYNYQFTNENDWTYEEFVGQPNTAFVFGGGHVGTAICKILATLDFYIIQLDNRKNLQMMHENLHVHKKIFCDFSDVADHIHEGDTSYFIIVTYSRHSDAIVLEKIINKKSKYIGLMGSRTKIAKIFNIMRSKGITKDVIKKVKAPIGLEINDQSVEEIAISVVAELIQVKNSDK